jgi:hypothetical protein
VADALRDKGRNGLLQERRDAGPPSTMVDANGAQFGVVMAFFFEVAFLKKNSITHSLLRLPF